MPKSAFDDMLPPSGAFFAGTPNWVAVKVAAIVEATGAIRFVGQIDVGGQPHGDVAKGVELYADKVVLRAN